MVGGPYRDAHAAKEGVVPPWAVPEGWAGSSQAPSSSLPVDNVGTSLKIGMMEVGAHEIQRVCPKKCCDVCSQFGAAETPAAIPLPPPQQGLVGLLPSASGL